MKVLVTGANGFVGSRLTPRLVEEGHTVVAATLAGDAPCEGCEHITVDLTDSRSANRLARCAPDAVVHLAAFSAASESEKDPGQVYDVNVSGTVRLVEALARVPRSGSPVRFLHVSSGQIYGGDQQRPFREDDVPFPLGPYATSKWAGERAVLDAHRRTSLDVIVARPFPHTGPGQDRRFVVPAFVRRVKEAKRFRASAVGVGNLDPVRDVLHVTDVVNAYLLLLNAGRPGHVYNVASGLGVTVLELFQMVAEAVGYRVVPEADTAFIRRAETPYSVGDASRLRSETGWSPTISLAQTIREVVDAEAD
jgi:GDP-4-dehydro-6-deoxy-D-mannose reductase